jgi:hypothetical protein
MKHGDLFYIEKQIYGPILVAHAEIHYCWV